VLQILSYKQEVAGSSPALPTIINYFPSLLFSYCAVECAIRCLSGIEMAVGPVQDAPYLLVPETVPRVRIPSAPPYSLEVQRKPPGFHCKLREMGAISRIFPKTGSGESALLNACSELCGVFLRRALEQSGFGDSIRRMQCDHKSSKSAAISEAHPVESPIADC
jgi:hypothetical protein